MAVRIGIAPDSWGVWFPASDPNNAKQTPWWRCLDEMKVAGYEGCEIGPWGYMPNDDPLVLKNAMDARSLELVGATEGGNFLDEASAQQMLKDIDDISELLKAFPSAKYIVLLPPMYTNLATGELEMVKCAVNPIMGQQLADKTQDKVAKHKKKVLVAGGGPAGMEAAITLAQRGHNVTLMEKQEKLGGNLHPAGAAYFKEDILKLIKVLEKRTKKAGVNILLNKEVTKEVVKEFDPDAIIVAIGSEELVPPIKGIDHEKVIMAIDAELHPEKLGKKVVIMGGGLVGAEGAIGFEHEGKECTIVEMKSSIAEEVNSFYRGGLMPEVERSAKCLVNTKVVEITNEGVICQNEKEKFLVEADSVVCALGFKSPYAKVDELADIVDESYIIGDCNKVGKIYEAISGAYYTALRI